MAGQAGQCITMPPFEKSHQKGESSFVMMAEFSSYFTTYIFDPIIDDDLIAVHELTHNNSFNLEITTLKTNCKPDNLQSREADCIQNYVVFSLS